MTTGKTADKAAPAATMRAERPMMVYIPSDDATDKVTRKLEDVVFKSEKLAIGARFFDTIKISAGEATQDRILSENGRRSPRIVFMTRDYKVTAVLEKSSLSAGKMVRAMKSLARKEYATKFDKMVSGYGKLLNELDRLEARRTKINDMKKRLEAKPNPSKQKKLQRTEAAYNKDKKAWEEREKAHLTFKFKDAPKTEP